MDKTRQRELSHWLHQQRRYARRWLWLSSFLGLLSALLIVMQCWLLASLLQHFIILHQPRQQLIVQFGLLLLCFTGRALLSWLREMSGYRAGEVIRRTLRKKVLDRLHALGPAWINNKPVGSWSTLLLEQTENMQDYFARYLPQMTLALLIPCAILIAIFPVNWAAGLILLTTAPLIPLFMALIGMGAADASRRNFLALSRLGGEFLDRLRGLDTLRLFHRARAETEHITASSRTFRLRTMEVLRIAFLSSAVLEFFTAVSIAVVAVYFGFSYLGELNFGHYQQEVTLFAGFLVLMLAPEFFQPLRDLGTFYHARAQAIGAADSLEDFLTRTDGQHIPGGTHILAHPAPVTLQAQDVSVLSPDGAVLAGPLSFTLPAGKRVALVGPSGAGKSSLINLLLGFLPYQGSLTVNGQPLHALRRDDWHQQLAWVGQNPHLPAGTVGENIFGESQPDEPQLRQVLAQSGVDEFLRHRPLGLESATGDQATGFSVGQAQRIAVARALAKPCQLLLLDEPGASLDARSEQQVMSALHAVSCHQTTLLVTHRLDQLMQWDEIWFMRDGQIIQQGSWQQLTSQPGPFADLLAQRRGSIA